MSVIRGSNSLPLFPQSSGDAGGLFPWQHPMQSVWMSWETGPGLWGSDSTSSLQVLHVSDKRGLSCRHGSESPETSVQHVVESIPWIIEAVLTAEWGPRPVLVWCTYEDFQTVKTFSLFTVCLCFLVLGSNVVLWCVLWCVCVCVCGSLWSRCDGGC